MKPVPSFGPEPIRLDIPSNVACIRPVHAFVHEVAAHGGMDDERAHDFALAVEEALVNAIEHGNGGDSGKRVFLEIERSLSDLSVRVSDQGTGFKVEDVPDPTAPENLERASGRGILFMRAFADDVSFEARPGKGTSVVLRKRFDTDGAGSAGDSGGADPESSPGAPPGAAPRKPRKKK